MNLSPEQKKSIWQTIANAILAIITALCASSCTLYAMGNTPFGSLIP